MALDIDPFSRRQMPASGGALSIIDTREGSMELKATIQDTRGAQEEREWELTDEDLDRSGDPPDRRRSCSCSFPFTSRPCSCQRCQCR